MKILKSQSHFIENFAILLTLPTPRSNVIDTHRRGKYIHDYIYETMGRWCLVNHRSTPSPNKVL
jgi:hypothetical protein